MTNIKISINLSLEVRGYGCLTKHKRKGWVMGFIQNVLALIREEKMPSGLVKSQGTSYDASLLHLLESTNVSDCINAYTSAAPGSTIEKKTVDKIKKLANSFDDWLKIFQSVSPMSSLGILASEELTRTASTFDHWRAIHSHCSNDILSSKALEKMAAFAHSKEEQIIVYNLAPAGSEINTSMLDALKSQTKGFDDWKALLDSSEGDLEKFATVMVIDLVANDLDSISELFDYEVIENDSDLTNKALEKLRAVRASSEDWTSLYENTENDEVKKLALEEMIKKIDSVESLIAVHEAVDEDNRDNEFDRLFNSKAKEILVTKEACDQIAENYYADDSLFILAFEYLLSQVANTRGLFDLFLSLLDDWEIEGGGSNDELVEKVTEKLLSVATQNEIYIMSKLGDERDEFTGLAEKAEEKLNEVSGISAT